MLEIVNLRAGYGGAEILRGIDVRVEQGEMVALVGANGAGKSTLLKTISGLVTASPGSVRFRGEDLTNVSTGARVRAGIAHVPEGRQIFGELSVEDNLRMGAYSQLRRISTGEITSRIDRVFTLFPALRDARALPAGRLSGGQQQMLAIGRGLMPAPALLLLDEPSLGLSPALVGEIFRTLTTLQQSGTSILLAEQNARLSLAIANRGYLLENGRIATAGSGAELLRSASIVERYLGLGSSHAEPVAQRARTQALGQRLREVLRP